MRKRFSALALALCLILSLAPTSALAARKEPAVLDSQPVKMTIETSAPTALGQQSAGTGTVDLADGRHEKWIDRVDLPDFAKKFYDVLVEASDNDGQDDFLIEDKYYAYEEGKDLGSNQFSPSLVGTVVQMSGQYSGGGSYKGKRIVAAALGPDDPDNDATYVTACLNAVLNAFDRDCSSVFWRGGSAYTGYGVRGDYTYYFLYLTSSEVDANGGTREIDFRIPEMRSETNIKKVFSQMDADIKTIVGGIPSGADRYATLAYFNDWLTKHNEYNTHTDINSSDCPWDMREACNALAGKTGLDGPVCESYARAMKALCEEAGIPCTLVDGNAKSSQTDSGEAHMWNYIQMEDGKWYAVDVTWDDPVFTYNGVPKTGAVSGGETDKWLLIGSDTLVNTGFKFISSHPVTNRTSNNGVQFTNGPELNPTAYAKLTYSGLPESLSEPVTLTPTRAPQRKGDISTYTYSVTSANLPKGLTLNSGTGVISGAVSETLTDSVTVNVALLENSLAAAGCDIVFPGAGEHVFSKEWSHDESTHWHACTAHPSCPEKGEEGTHTFVTKYDKDSHWQECSVCGYVKGSKTAHTMEEKFDQNNHWKKCSDCDYATEKTPHTLTTQSDAAGHWESCSGCAYTTETAKEPHTLVWRTTDTEHWQACDCGYTTDHESHSLTSGHDDSGHWQECQTCKYKTASSPHELEWRHSDTQHWQSCDCGYTTAHVSHVLETKSDDTAHWQACAQCGYSTEHENHHLTPGHDDSDHWQECSDCHRKVGTAPHSLGGWQQSEAEHWRTCSGCDFEERSAHQWGSGEVTKEPTYEEPGVRTYTCEVCGRTKTEEIPARRHTLDDVWHSDESGHWHECSEDGCEGLKFDEAPHSFDNGVVKTPATCEGQGVMVYTCTVCQYTKEEAIQPTGHKWSSTLSHDGTGHWYDCENDCGQKKDFEAHSSERKYDAAGHWDHCTLCGYESDHENHSLTWEHSDSQHWQTCNCGYATGKVSHVLTVKGGEQGHWYECQCGYKSAVTAHTMSWYHSDEGHWQTCSVCQYATDTASHKLEVRSDASGHWSVCDECGYTTESAKETHTFDWETDENGHRQVCQICKFATELENHTLTAQYDATNHWQECSDCGYKTGEAAHSLTWAHNDSQHWQACSGCDYTTESAKETHTFDWETDESGHRQVCRVCKFATERENHTLTAKCDATSHWQECSDCGYKTGEAAHTLAWAHSDSEHWQACSGCNYTTEHENHTLEYSHDATAHWQSCAECGFEGARAEHAWYEEITAPATCEEAGVKSLTCPVCGEAKTEPIPATGHKPTETWSHDSAGHWHECENGCGKLLDYAAHAWGEAEVELEPSALTAGIRAYTCDDCGERRSEAYFEDAEILISAGDTEVDTSALRVPENSSVSVSDIAAAAQGIGVDDLAGHIPAEICLGALNAAGINPDSAREALGGKADGGEITIILDPYLSVEAKSFTEEGELKALTLDIHALYTVTVTTEPQHMTASNSVTMVEGADIDVLGRVVVNVPLPQGFIPAFDTPVYVRHKGYEYTAWVVTGEDGGLTAKFENPHGFSEFVLTTGSSAVAELDGVTYTSLQAAVDAAEDGDVITVLGPTSETVTVERELTFTLADEDGLFTGSVAAGSGYTVRKTAGEGETTYTIGKKTAPAGGGAAPSGTYPVTINTGDNGSVEASHSTAAPGETVTLTVTCDTGYTPVINVNCADGTPVELTPAEDGTYTFTMPASGVTVSAIFEKVELLFTDVGPEDWYYDSVWYVYTHGRMEGIDSATFNPDGTATRAEVVTVLWRMADRMQANLLLAYNDVEEELWYTEAIRWATAAQVAQGYGDSRFGPGDLVNREQFAVMLYGLARWLKMDLTVEGEPLTAFPDAGDVSPWALEAMAWAVDRGIITGTGEGTLSPQGSALRSQLAAMTQRFDGLEK